MGVWGALLQGVLSVDSQITEGKAAEKQAAKNTELANEAAADALIRGKQDASAVVQAGSELAARQFVAFSASGVDASTGTAADVQASTVASAKLEALTIENNAAREAWGYKKHGLDFQTQAGIASSRRNRETAGTVLGSLGNAASEYSKKGWGV